MRKNLPWVFLVFVVNSAYGQWLGYHVPGTPRSLTASAPKAANGKPDLSGVWHVEPTSLAEMKRIYGDDVNENDLPGMEADTISKYALNILLDFKAADSPMRPEAAPLLKQHVPGTNPADRCLPIGIPAAMLVSEPDKIVQAPGLIVIMYESDGTHRQIYTDGRPLPKDPQPAWLGYSIGKWQGDTLVVDTAGFNDKSWLDLLGHPHSEALHVVERYRRRDFGHLDVEMTFDDPKIYTQPITIKVTQDLLADSDILEYFCNENEKDRPHSK
jgi:hypothetical protein